MSAWTCPCCPLNCDQHASPAAARAACPRAEAQLAAHEAACAQPATARVDGRPATLDEACRAAAALLGRARQPLVAGLGADVHGARALYPLACALGAITDSAGGEAPWHGLRALQDRGQFTTTLAEVRQHADLVVFLGGLPGAVAPLFAERLGLFEPQGQLQQRARHVVVLGERAGDAATLAAWPRVAGLTHERLPLAGDGRIDLYASVALLATAIAAPWTPNVPPELVALAARLQAARYAVLVAAQAELPAQGALVVEAVHRIVGSLNRSTRAAALWLGGANGVATAQQAFTWLSGLPLRTRIGPRGLEHAPAVHIGEALMEDRAVDALLWVSAFEAAAKPPPHAAALDLPTVVLGHPGQAASCDRPGSVFIPVATPGLNATGHVFRTDGTVLVPLWPMPGAGTDLPSVADAAARIQAALPPARARAGAGERHAAAPHHQEAA